MPRQTSSSAASALVPTVRRCRRTCCWPDRGSRAGRGSRSRPRVLEHELGHLDAAAELVRHLLVGAEEVGVVLREAADAGHAVELARLLVAIDGAELGQPHRQVAVAPRLALVDLHVVRAVHRLEQVALLLVVPSAAAPASLLSTESLALYGPSKPATSGRVHQLGLFLRSRSRARRTCRSHRACGTAGRRAAAGIGSERSAGTGCRGSTESGRWSGTSRRGRCAAYRPAGSRGGPALRLMNVFELPRIIAPLGSHRTSPGRPALADREQLELLAQHAMVAALGLFDLASGARRDPPW